MSGVAVGKTIVWLAVWSCLGLAFAVRADEVPVKAAGAKTQGGQQSAAKKELVFRQRGLTNTAYFVFEPDGSYQFISREHLFTAVLGRGTWKQDAQGRLVLTSTAQRTRGKVYHVEPTRYRGWVFLASADHPFIKIYAGSPEKAKRAVDKTGASREPDGLFIATDVAKFRGEVATPQPFLFYPEMNRPREQPVLDMTGK